MTRREIDIYYKNVKVQLEEKLTKASEILTSIEQKLNETDTNRQQSASTLATLNENYNSAITLINQTRDDLSRVTELRTLALDPETGVDSLLNKIGATSEQATKFVAQISGLDKDSATKNEAITDREKDSSILLSRIEGSSAKADSLLKDLEKTYQLAINTGLAGSFDNRKKEIQKEFVDSWGKRFNLSIFILGILAAIVLLSSWLISGFTLEWLTIFRLALLTPLIFYSGYTAVQYGKERRLLEKYAFKAAVAASIESYTTILRNNFKDKKHEESILQFVLTSMSLIYSEPNEEVRKRSYGFTFGNKLGEIKSELIEEITQEIKKEFEGNDK